MGHKCQRFAAALRALIQPAPQGVRILQHDGRAAPSGNSDHLGMGRDADDDRLPAAFLCALHKAVNLCDIGACGVNGLAPLGRQCVVYRPSLSMGTENHSGARRDIPDVRKADNTLFLQMRRHMIVMDNRAKHIAWLLTVGSQLGQLHRPPDAVTKPGGPCEFQPHIVCTSSARIRAIRSAVMASYSSCVPLRDST